MVEKFYRSKVGMFLLAFLFAGMTFFTIAAPQADAYTARLCSGYGSVYHTHSGPPKYWMYTYSYMSGGYPYDEYWTWDYGNGWRYQSWSWC